MQQLKKKTFDKFDRLNIMFRLTFGQGKTNEDSQELTKTI